MITSWHGNDFRITSSSMLTWTTFEKNSQMPVNWDRVTFVWRIIGLSPVPLPGMTCLGQETKSRKVWSNYRFFLQEKMYVKCTMTYSFHPKPFNGCNYLPIGFRLMTTWWRRQMQTFSAWLAICAGNSPVPGEFPAQWPVTRSFDVFFDLRLNKRLSKQSWGWWFETLSCPLWRHCNEFAPVPIYM